MLNYLYCTWIALKQIIEIKKFKRLHKKYYFTHRHLKLAHKIYISYEKINTYHEKLMVLDKKYAKMFTELDEKTALKLSMAQSIWRTKE